jgi:hypothetical protein
MTSKFNKIRHGCPDDLDYLLDTEPMNEQELRAALQNLLEHITRQDQRIQKLELTAKQHAERLTELYAGPGRGGEYAHLDYH